MTQPDLFDRLPFPEKFTRTGTSIVPPTRAEIVRARATDPQTSKDAARRVGTFDTGHFHLILRALRLHGPLNASGIAAAISNLNEHRILKRLGELESAGKIELARDAKGEPIVRAGSSGRGQRVWRAV